MTSCPVCAVDSPPARRLWGPTLGFAGLGLVAVCCGISALSSLVGGGASLASYGVLALLLGLIAVDLALRTQRPYACGHPRRALAGLAAVRVVTTALLPWNLATFLFAPRHRLAPEDRVITILSRLRVVLGLAIVVGVALWYDAYERLQPEAVLENWALTALLAIPSFLLCLAVVVLASRPGQRAATLRQLRWPLLSLAGFGVPVALYLLFVQFADDVDGYLTSQGVQLPLNGMVYGGVFGLWLLIFSFRAAYLVTKNWFNAVDGHLLLPPIIATWMSWLAVVIALTGDAGGPPRPVSLTLIIGGAATTTAIAVAEAWRTYRRYGVTLRSGAIGITGWLT